MDKPLVRWTVGNVVWEGFDALEMSVDSWNQLYGDEFNKVICHNSLSESKLERLERLGVQLIDQSQHAGAIKHEPSGPAWKLYPPRLNISSHELFIDNDLVLYKRLPAIDEYLRSGELFIITSAYKAFYGSFIQLVPKDLLINSGLFGLPPKFDLGLHINRLIAMYPMTGWKDHCDDEGVLACIFSKKKLQVIPIEHITPCNPNFVSYRTGEYGTHFVSMNSGFISYWKRFTGEKNEAID